jgi:hypothetical protein
MLIVNNSIGFSPNRSIRIKYCRDVPIAIADIASPEKRGTKLNWKQMKRELSEFYKSVKQFVKSWVAVKNFWFFPKPLLVFVKKERRE